MRVLMLSTSDLRGGAALAAFRLHQALKEKMVDSHMLVQDRQSHDKTTHATFQHRLVARFWGKVRNKLDQLALRPYSKRTENIFTPSRVAHPCIKKKINQLNPDIVHLHWVGRSFMDIEGIEQIKQPIVWTCHDNWAFTGGCHLVGKCEKYKQQCGKCPSLGSEKEYDLSRSVWQRKHNTYANSSSMTVVSPSYWMYNNAKSSSLLKRKTHACIPNPIDRYIFRSKYKEQARIEWGLDLDKRIIVFGAHHIEYLIKGFKELCSALSKIQTKDVELVVFGHNNKQRLIPFKGKVHYVGYVNDEYRLAFLYSAADVCVVPSLQENLVQTAIESISCATPVVAFHTGGMPDIIDHRQNGYLARPYDTSDLAFGIDWILSNKDYQALSKSAEEKCRTHFDKNVVVERYLSLYKNILSRFSG